MADDRVRNVGDSPRDNTSGLVLPPPATLPTVLPAPDDSATFQPVFPQGAQIGGVDSDGAGTLDPLASAGSVLSGVQVNAANGPNLLANALLATTPTNLMSNPGFETTTSLGEFNAAGTNCTVTNSSTRARFGDRSLRASATGAGTVVFTQPAPTGPYGSLTPGTAYRVTAGKFYEFACWARSGASTRAFTPAIVWYTANGTIISTTTPLGATTSSLTIWTELIVNDIAPATAEWATVYVSIAAAGGASELHYIDDVYFQEAVPEWLSSYNDNYTKSIQITDVYDPYTVEVLADSPSGYWQLNELSGTTATDSSGNGRNGTYVGATLGATGPFAYTPGLLGATFAGNTSSYITLQDLDAWSAGAGSAGAFSVEAWFYLTTYATPQTIMAKGNTSNYEFMLYVDTTGKLNFAEYNAAGSSASQAQYAGPVAKNVWHHVAVTFDKASNIQTLYYDGSSVATSATSQTIVNGTAPLTIGKVPDGWGPTSGTISNVAYYGTKLSTARVQAHYAARLTAPNPGPLGDDYPVMQVWTSGLSTDTTAYQSVPVTEGSTYTAAAYFYVSGTSRYGPLATIDWLDASGNTIRTDSAEGYKNAPGATWSRPTTTATAPTGAVEAVLSYGGAQTGIGQTMFLQGAYFGLTGSVASTIVPAGPVRGLFAVPVTSSSFTANGSGAYTTMATTDSVGAARLYGPGDSGPRWYQVLAFAQCNAYPLVAALYEVNFRIVLTLGDNTTIIGDAVRIAPPILAGAGNGTATGLTLVGTAYLSSEDSASSVYATLQYKTTTANISILPSTLTALFIPM